MPNRDAVAVIGAGPHGLATAAHLRHTGVSVKTFGDTFSFWRDHMPKGMLLRSAPRSSHIADPDGELTLDAWAAAAGRPLGRPVPLSDYLEYGSWFQRRAVPDVDPRRVVNLSYDGGGFGVELDDGEQFGFKWVVLAAGIAPFPRVPAPLARIGEPLVSHSSVHNDFSGFAGRRVTVLGCGQSALESAALLRESGAQVEVIARASEPHFLPALTAERELLPKAPTDVGNRVTSWLSAAPSTWRWLPAPVRPSISFGCIRPAGAGWLRPRLNGVHMTMDRTIASAHADGDEVVLQLSDGQTRRAEHLIAATGFAIDVTAYEFLDRALVERLRVVEGYPVLKPGLEASVPGLHFVGAPAAYSFGPVMRFVVGSWFCGPAVAAAISGKRSAGRFWAFAPRRVLAASTA